MLCSAAEEKKNKNVKTKQDCGFGVSQRFIHKNGNLLWNQLGLFEVFSHGNDLPRFNPKESWMGLNNSPWWLLLTMIMIIQLLDLLNAFLVHRRSTQHIFSVYAFWRYETFISPNAAVLFGVYQMRDTHFVKSALPLQPLAKWSIFRRNKTPNENKPCFPIPP